MKNRYMVFLILLIITACDNSKTKTMEVKTISDPLTRSINGYAPVNGINMYYEIHGAGEPLVLIHGG